MIIYLAPTAKKEREGRINKKERKRSLEISCLAVGIFCLNTEIPLAAKESPVMFEH